MTGTSFLYLLQSVYLQMLAPEHDAWLKKCIAERCAALPPQMYPAGEHSPWWGPALILCFAVASLAILALFYEARRRSKANEYDADDCLEASERIRAGIREIPRLEGELLRKTCQAIAKDMMRNTGFILRELYLSYDQMGPDSRDHRDAEMEKSIFKITDEGGRLHFRLWQAGLVLSCKPLLARRYDLLLRSRNQLLDAADQHVDVWAAFLKLRSYPELCNLLRMLDKGSKG